jgi:hypothetical protein
MSAAPQPFGPERLERALDRLQVHCDLVGRMTDAVEEHRADVRARLEQELGPELTRRLLTGLSRSA